MLYDTLYRHNQALSPSGLETLPAALHALNAAVADCRRAGKSIERDASVLLLIGTLARAAERVGPGTEMLRQRCAADRAAVIEAPALLAIAGHSVAGDEAAKRTFHVQARRALTGLADAIGLDPDGTRITSALGRSDDDGISTLAHDDLAIRVVPRSFLPASEISFNRCRAGEPAGKVHLAPIAELVDHAAFARRLAVTVGPIGLKPLAAAA